MKGITAKGKAYIDLHPITQSIFCWSLSVNVRPSDIVD